MTERIDIPVSPMKLSGTWGRVVRSPIPERGQVIVMAGEQFEDGKDRIIVGFDVSPDAAHDLDRLITARDEAYERMQRLIAAINATMHDNPEEDSE